MPAPKGNKNASHAISYLLLEAYAGLVAVGYITREQARLELQVGPGRARRWMRIDDQQGPPNPLHLAARRRYIGPAERKAREAERRVSLRVEIAKLIQPKPPGYLPQHPVIPEAWFTRPCSLSKSKLKDQLQVKAGRRHAVLHWAPAEDPDLASENYVVLTPKDARALGHFLLARFPEELPA